MSMTPEKRIQNKIIKFLEELIDKGYPVYYERRQAGGLNYKLGLPDLYAIVNGAHVEIEVKAGSGERSAAQIRWEERLTRINCHYILAYSVDDVKKFMEVHFGIKEKI